MATVEPARASPVTSPATSRVSPIVRTGPVPAGGGEWDVVIVGEGLGGATLGHELAAAGRSALFVEKGHDAIGGSAAGAEMLEDPVARGDGGLVARPDGGADRRARHHAVPRAGLWARGGSSLLFAAALERFDRSDVETMPGDAHRPAAGPIAWAAMAQGYARAERLYRVVGTPDPLSPDTPALPRPPPASAVDDALAAAFTAAGLHPYRLHVGMAYRAGCGECGGRVCAMGCKSDARRICIEPAVTRYGARLVADAEVETVEADATHATGVVYARAGVAYRVRGRMDRAGGGRIPHARDPVAVAQPRLARRTGEPHRPGRAIP